MLALDLSKKDETKEQELQSRIFDCLKKKEMSWQDFLFFTGSNSSVQCVQAPRKENTYNKPSIGFYEDGTVWVSGAKGSVQMFKKCPYLLMFERFMQRYNEVNNDNI